MVIVTVMKLSLIIKAQSRSFLPMMFFLIHRAIKCACFLVATHVNEMGGGESP
jgi:hypothetical protein